MNNDLISVIVPVYNVEKYLKKCVYSLLCQTYQNFEVILVDDGSTDSSGNLCDQLAVLDSRIIVLHKKNGGLSDARNAGIDVANGSYISFVDSDDYVDSSFLEILYTNAIENDAEISISNFEKVYENSIPHCENTEIKKVVMSNHQGLEALFYDKYNYQFTMACGKIFKKSILQDFKFPVGRNYEDSATAHILISKANKIVYTNRKQYYYLTRGTSITKSDKFLKDDAIVAMKDRVDWFADNEYADLEIQAQIQYVLTMMGVYARLTNSKEALRKKVELYDNVKNYVKCNRGLKSYSKKIFIQIELFLLCPTFYSVIVRIVRKK